MRIRHRVQFALLAVAALLCLAAGGAQAQGRGRGRGKDNGSQVPPGLAKKGGLPPGQAKKMDRAIVVTRDVLVHHGYTLVRIENDGPVRVVFYRVGSGPVQRFQIRPEGDDDVVVERAPRALLVDINIRLR